MRRNLVTIGISVLLACSQFLSNRADAWIGNGCTWPHTPGQFSFVYYIWGDSIDADPFTNWRDVFTYGRDAWNGAQGRIRIIEVIDTPGQYNSYWIADDTAGKTWATCSGGTFTSYVSGGNRYNSPYPGAELGVIGAHEIGHSLGLGHSDDGNPPEYISVMVSFWYQGQPQYPQPDDLNGIDTLYP